MATPQIELDTTQSPLVETIHRLGFLYNGLINSHNTRKFGYIPTRADGYAFASLQARVSDREWKPLATFVLGPEPDKVDLIIETISPNEGEVSRYVAYNENGEMVLDSDNSNPDYKKAFPTPKGDLDVKKAKAWLEQFEMVRSNQLPKRINMPGVVEELETTLAQGVVSVGGFFAAVREQAV
ncbi:MAG: hypothetical protein UX85_C0002G0029 [Candidatus Beckwithbacteria bacterium GW2011_GWB1_47_15]|uniref:Uncharacterized protein n=1 Tax=Candidatus Beckwithbacteria bacterium GW2011_GWB1_47_15 TaxID=1618371 RepID=A0A0G1RWH3_9BACT|nr:MAG: hypothetical protein UY43_C0001G0617 [Candidatus Beckwithbacteria bacterium GW2011_GWC1_49_16]KKU35595.1 MAG: hypothetical protein UX50_C0002G0022 [Candidatus Beckwithbacteria bacterium GW2011_GWA1_46_30]KKU61649.1 MAG: hypothetical protein UX85_C0002G0029 [Candidatus Beckwithbacteria bacterium GW2011_GWB1_47_15]KKU72152.1 MAG: hypothetical protein UX97_C0001G0022 [Candidatus Beckwithbacteria bacterium GW2011_GWA2_47_25]KKW04777.1 MAG: hypothetical protein UY37_C0002G0030 [Candidatus Be